MRRARARGQWVRQWFDGIGRPAQSRPFLLLGGPAPWSLPYDLPGFGFGLGFAKRTEPGISPVEGSDGEINWSGAGGATFWVDPKEDMFVVLMAQTVWQRGRIRNALKNMVYGALEK